MTVRSTRTAAIALAAAGLLLTAACSKNDSSGTTSSTSSTTSSTSSSSSSSSSMGSMTSGTGSSTMMSGSSSAGGGSASAPTSTSTDTVAFLMPDNGSTRYEQHDHPGFVAEMAKTCPGCKLIYNNAAGDATKQQDQFNSALTQGAKVIVLDPVDSKQAVALVGQAQAKGVKVIAYDRPIPDAKPDFYVSFDNEKIGQLISKSLVDKLKSGTVPDGSGILEVNGSPTDAAAGLIKKGIHEGLDGSGIKTLDEYDTPDWAPDKAQAWVSGKISQYGTKIVGVVAANDGTGGGAIAAFKASNVNPVPPVTGNDATNAGLQLIISGDEYNTINKPSEIVAGAAADVATTFLNGQTPTPDTTVFNAPSKLFTPVVITAANIKAEIFDKGIAKVSDICTGNYAAGCTKLGIS